MYKSFFLVFCSLLCGSSLFGQLGGPQISGARSLGTGGVGLTFQDVHAGWGNPAGLASLNQTSFALFAEQRFALSDIRQVSAVGAFALGESTGGLTVSYYGFEGYNEQRIGLLYGRKLGEKIQLGAQLYTLGVNIPEYGNKQVVSFELGLLTAISPSVTLAGKVTNPVRVSLLEGDDLPSVISAGFQYQPGTQVSIFGEVEKDILYPARVRLGLEYQLLESFFLRAGIATAPSLLSFGIGYLLVDQWRLDFAASYHQYLGFTPGIGVVYSGKEKK
ncbi:hypothetical protein [Lewinella sp. LCG006]|uniref:hypothetical protein n=1 Tax=Lewinella sp. LCG006 TaxID=3231911 RepID=UPI0034615054